jgi:thymidylate kinase
MFKNFETGNEIFYLYLGTNKGEIMKLLIVEGMDNVGKDTMINEIRGEFDRVKIVHFDKPKSKDNIEAAKEQKETFHKALKQVVEDYKNDSYDLVIFNRSYQGELVYGTLYRGREASEVKTQNLIMDTFLENNLSAKDICFVTLLADDLHFIRRNDDGLSLSNNDMEKLAKERELFLEAYKFSAIKRKKLIYVNDGPFAFRPKNSIKEEILNELNRDEISNVCFYSLTEQD